MFQDGREVKAKASKTFRCQFFPVGRVYRNCFAEWVAFLKLKKMFGPNDALFPKARIEYLPGRGFADVGIDRVGFSGPTKLNTIIRNAFAAVQMPEYTPHSFRKTLMSHGDEICSSAEELKAWSMNFGHENLSTSINHYLPVSEERQLEIINCMKCK